MASNDGLKRLVEATIKLLSSLRAIYSARGNELLNLFPTWENHLETLPETFRKFLDAFMPYVKDLRKLRPDNIVSCMGQAEDTAFEVLAKVAVHVDNITKPFLPVNGSRKVTSKNRDNLRNTLRGLEDNRQEWGRLQTELVRELSKLSAALAAGATATIVDHAMLSSADIAKHFPKLTVNAVSKRLDRWRLETDTGWQEVTDRKPHEAKYLYQWGSVKHLFLPPS